MSLSVIDAVTASRRRRPSSRSIVLVVVSAYAIFFLYAYSHFVTPDFGYLGYVDNGVNWVWRVGALLFAAVPAVWIPLGPPRASSIVIWLLFLLAYIPSQLVPYLVIAPPTHVASWSVTLALAFWVLCAATKRPPRRALSFDVPSALFWVLLGGLFALFVAVAYSQGARIAASEISIDNVYATRFMFRGQVAVAGPLLGYLVFWGVYVVNPLLLSVGLVQRRWVLLAAGLSGQLLAFSLTGLKFALLSPGLVALLILAVHKRRKVNFGILITLLLISAVLVSIILQLRGNSLLTYLLVRRTMSTPGLLSAYYFDFFSTHAPTFFSHTILKFFLHNPYGAAPPFLIGRVYFHNPLMSANANLFADGFAGLGYPGMVLEAGAAGLFLRLLDTASVGRDLRVLAGPLGMCALALVDTGLSTALLTDGSLLLLILVLLLPRTPIAPADPDQSERTGTPLVEERTYALS